METTKGQNAYVSVIEKCWNDASFKNKLIDSEDPVSVIESGTGIKMNVPSNYNVVVVDQTDPNTVHINIPRKRDVSDVELTDDQMESVAGGLSIVPFLPLILRFVV